MLKIEIKEKARMLYENGFGSLQKIADEIGVNVSTVKSWKQRDKIKWIKPTKSKSKNTRLKEIAVRTELTDKERIFCEKYIESFNVKIASINAGISEKKGYKLLKTEEAKKYLEELKMAYITPDYATTQRIIERHKAIAFANITDFTDFKQKEIIVDYDEEGRPIKDTVFSFTVKNCDKVDGSIIKKIGVGKNGAIIELEDRSKSLDFLTKFYGLDVASQVQKEKLELEKEKIKILEEKNKLLEEAKQKENKGLEDLSEEDLDNILKKYGAFASENQKVNGKEVKVVYKYPELTDEEVERTLKQFGIEPE